MVDGNEHGVGDGNNCAFFSSANNESLILCVGKGIFVLNRNDGALDER